MDASTQRPAPRRVDGHSDSSGAVDSTNVCTPQMKSKDIVYVNGSFLPRAEARVSVEDRGFVFGDGVYEVLRVVSGKLFAARFHNDRLKRSLDGVRISLSEADSPEGFVEIGKQLLRENGLLDGQATLYIQITRGAATR